MPIYYQILDREKYDDLINNVIRILYDDDPSTMCEKHLSEARNLAENLTFSIPAMVAGLLDSGTIRIK